MYKKIVQNASQKTLVVFLTIQCAGQGTEASFMTVVISFTLAMFTAPVAGCVSCGSVYRRIMTSGRVGMGR